MRIALTGGATGIGAETAARLRARGDHVTVFDIQEPKENVDIWIETDLSDPNAIHSALEKVNGPFDALINNAGVPPREGQQELVLRLNYFGLKTFQDAMLNKLARGASIVNVASRAGAQWRENLDEVKALINGNPDDLPEFIRSHDLSPARAYNLSKEAVIVMSQRETAPLLARDIRVNSVSPAAVSTGILPDFAAAFGDKMVKNLALTGRAGEAGEIADVIIFLASPESRWIKGQDVVVDGGMSAMLTQNTLEF